MLLVRRSVLKRSGTSELSVAAVDEGRLRGAHAGPLRRGLVAEQGLEGRGQLCRVTVFDREHLDERVNVRCLVQLANQLSNQRHARRRAPNDNGIGTGIGRHDGAGQNARIDTWLLSASTVTIESEVDGDVVFSPAPSPSPMIASCKYRRQILGRRVVQRKNFHLVLRTDLLHIQLVDQTCHFDHVTRHGTDDQRVGAIIGQHTNARTEPAKVIARSGSIDKEIAYRRLSINRRSVFASGKPAGGWMLRSAGQSWSINSRRRIHRFLASNQQQRVGADPAT